MCSVPVARCLALEEKNTDRVTPFLGTVISFRTGHPSSSLRRAMGPGCGRALSGKGQPTRQWVVRPSHTHCSLSQLSGTGGPSVGCTDRVQAERPEVKFQLFYCRLSDPGCGKSAICVAVSSSIIREQ